MQVFSCTSTYIHIVHLSFQKQLPCHKHFSATKTTIPLISLSMSTFAFFYFHLGLYAMSINYEMLHVMFHEEHAEIWRAATTANQQACGLFGTRMSYISLVHWAYKIKVSCFLRILYVFVFNRYIPSVHGQDFPWWSSTPLASDCWRLWSPCCHGDPTLPW